MKAKHIFGTITIVAIIGGVVYGIKKSKDMKKAEGDEITLAEAKAIVSNKEFDKEYPTYFKEESTDNVKFTVGPIDVEGVPHSFEVRPYSEEPFEEEEEEYEEENEEEILVDVYPPEHGRPWAETITEEEKVLRYEPSSIDALDQFKRMELAEWAAVDETYQTMARLFEFPFQPQNDGDDMLRTQIIDYRVQFFGFGSKWVQQVTFADVILHYARAAHFNCDESVKYWVEYFLEFNDLYHGYSSNTIDQALRALNSHAYFNEERATFGLFGLTRTSMDNAIRIANRNVDRSVTYEIEFNEFLKSCL